MRTQYHHHLLLISIALVMLFISGALKGVRDTLAFHPHEFHQTFPDANPSFWDSPAETWCNKYQSCEDLTPRFWGSSTFLVAFTDGWHLMELGVMVFSICAILFYIPEFYWLYLLADFVVFYIVRSAGFFLTYNWIF